jgi:hypothetical protein
MDINEKYQSRISASYEKIKGAYEHRNDGVLPFQVSDVNYWLSGETPDLIPDDYFTDCETMMQYQVKKIERHMEQFDDDYIPFLFPWYGTGVLASGFGSEVLFQDKLDPAVEGTLIKTPEDISRLSLPDPYKDGLMPRVLETIRYFRDHSDLPISFTDPQGQSLGLVYLFKQGTFYPFAPRPDNQRNNMLELQVRDEIGADLRFEPNLGRWFALWGAPGV